MTATGTAELRRTHGDAAKGNAADVRAKLYGLQGAGPSMAAALMLEHKGVSYRRVNLIQGRHRKVLQRRGFPGHTAPALDLGGRLVQTNRAIARALDEVVPAPPLLPADPNARRSVEEAERLGDEELQPVTRRTLLWAYKTNLESVGVHPRLGRPVPAWFARIPWLPGVMLDRALADYGVTAAVAKEDQRCLPAILDRIDAFVATRTLNGVELNAADFQIAPLICILMTVERLRLNVSARPSAALADRVLPATLQG